MLNVTNLLCGDPGHPEHHPRGRWRITCPSQAPRPVVSWAITQAANIQCICCHREPSAPPAQDELSFTEGLMLLEDLKAYDVPAVAFGGGEPLMRDDALDLIQHAIEIGLNATLLTNGTLIDDDIADRLAAMDLRSISIAIDGAERRHDTLRASAGAYRLAVEAIDRCKARGLRVAVRFSVNQFNHMDLDEVFDFCIDRGIDRLSIHHLVASKSGRLRNVELSAEQTRAVVDRIFERTIAEHEAGRRIEVFTVGNHSDASYMLTRLERTNPQRFHEARRALAAAGGNQSGINVAAIDPCGGVHYDPDSWHYTCGNVRERKFSGIWGRPTDPRLIILRDRYDYLPDRCRICRYVGLCNGNSRTRAEAATGDWLSCDPACYIRDDDLGLTMPSESVVPDLHAERHAFAHAQDARDVL